MKNRRPSPAMVVACIALFVALGGTGIAAIDFARNAGAVDGKSAVAAGATTAHAAGKLVATNSKGKDKGRLPGRFLSGVAKATTFGSSVQVADNQTGAPAALGTAPGIGTLTASCTDQDARPAIEDPRTTVTLTNSSGTTINLAKRIGGSNAAVVPQEPNTVQTLTIDGSNTFAMHAQNRGIDLAIDGVVRQDGRGTATASCLFYGTVTIVQ